MVATRISQRLRDMCNPHGIAVSAMDQERPVFATPLADLGGNVHYDYLDALYKVGMASNTSTHRPLTGHPKVVYGLPRSRKTPPRSWVVIGPRGFFPIQR